MPEGSTSAQDRPKRPTSRRSSSSSRSPTPTSSNRVASAGRGGAGSIGSLGPKRGNLRKKVLCGQIGLSGRRKSNKDQDRDGDDHHDDSSPEDAPESERSTSESAASIAASSTKTSASAPRVMISEPESSSSHPRGKYSLRSSPSSSFKGTSRAEAKGKDKEKFFPRSSSAGAGLAPTYRGSSSSSSNRTSGSPLLKPSPSPSFHRANVGSSNGQASESGRDNSRSSSIHWLDIAESRDRSQPYNHRSSSSATEPDSPKITKRTRTHSGATSLTSSSGDKELRREDRVRDPDEDPDEFAEEDEDEQDDRVGSRGLRDGMSRIGAFFSNFTAPKGEGMGNPGPTSHPHLFPNHTASRTKEEMEREKDRSRSESGLSSPPPPPPDRSPARSRRLQREPTDEPETLSLPPPSLSEPNRSAPRVMLNIPDQDEPVWPGRRS